tara:strand:- start:370 stop:504 length:135 start_codon:yes stop_codon:yes gene_type:complete
MKQKIFKIKLSFPFFQSNKEYSKLNEHIIDIKLNVLYLIIGYIN